MRGIDAVVRLGEIVGDPACALDEQVTLEINLAATHMAAVAGRLPRVYEARTMLLVDFAAPQTVPTYNDALLSQQLVKTYAQMIVQPIVLEEVGPRLQRDIGG